MSVVELLALIGVCIGIGVVITIGIVAIAELLATWSDTRDR